MTLSSRSRFAPDREMAIRKELQFPFLLDFTGYAPFGQPPLAQRLEHRICNATIIGSFAKALLPFKRIRGMSSPDKVLRFASNKTISAKEDIPKKKRSYMVLSIYETQAQLIAQN
ncbi:hypothetical protein TSUD_212480 [Trifolium subterraneum]|uniref:Uncharacterized protein n=1 Tax=Trifolium subterraneum TaxID=3900 RepID=A0A2Z6NVA4_TRISU|nr:hypothetical protein TSUD_212480 [Trifolium subterraneum]